MQLDSGGVVYVVVTGLILAVAIYTQANLLFWSFGLMVGGLLVSLLVSWQSLRNVKVQRLSPGHGVANDMMVLRYHITNRSWLPIFSLVITETWGKGRRGWKKTGPLAEQPIMLRGRPQGWVMHVGPNHTIQAEAPCWPLRRGTLHFERIILSSGFPFGVVRKTMEVEQPATVLVYPHLFRLNRKLLFSLSNFDPSGQKQLERGGGTEEFFGLRPYRHGDSLKIIDWKHSARTGELVSREMTQPSPPRLMVMLDLRHIDDAMAAYTDPNPPRKRRRKRAASASSSQGGVTPRQHAIERTISLVASIVCEAHFQGYQVGLAAAGCAFTPFPVHHSLPHRTRLLEALAQLDPEEAQRRTDALPAQPSLIVWPGAGDDMPGRGGGAGDVAVFGAADMEKYVLEGEGGERMLRQRNRPRHRRDDLTGQASDAPTEQAEDSAPETVHAK